MAQKVLVASCLEAARASALACHSAAGLLISAECFKAARLLRAAEALSRSAIADLTSMAKMGKEKASRVDMSRPDVVPLVEPTLSGARTSAKRRRRRRNKTKSGTDNVVPMGAEVPPSDSIASAFVGLVWEPCAAASLGTDFEVRAPVAVTSTDAPLVGAKPRRTLQPRVSGESSSGPCGEDAAVRTAFSASSVGSEKLGDLAEVLLAVRSELVGSTDPPPIRTSIDSSGPEAFSIMIHGIIQLRS